MKLRIEFEIVAPEGTSPQGALLDVASAVKKAETHPVTRWNDENLVVDFRLASPVRAFREDGSEVFA